MAGAWSWTATNRQTDLIRLDRPPRSLSVGIGWAAAIQQRLKKIVFFLNKQLTKTNKLLMSVWRIYSFSELLIRSKIERIKDWSLGENWCILLHLSGVIQIWCKYSASQFILFIRDISCKSMTRMPLINPNLYTRWINRWYDQRFLISQTAAQ